MGAPVAESTICPVIPWDAFVGSAAAAPAWLYGARRRVSFAARGCERAKLKRKIARIAGMETVTVRRPDGSLLENSPKELDMAAK
jgi:hypothetical protein